MSIDLMAILEPFISLVFAAAAAAAAVLVPFVVNWVMQKTKLDRLGADKLVREYLYTALDKAINLAKSKVAEKKVTVNVDNEIARMVYEYLSKMVPDALVRFGLTEEKIAEMVKARLVKFVVKE